MAPPPPTPTTVSPATMPRPPAVGGGHVRSASVPCEWHHHHHPLLADVDEQLLALRSWTSSPGPKYPLSLAHVRALLCVLDELLRLPLAHAALSRSRASDDALLDGFLVLADAFGTFLAALLALRQHAADLRAAVRRRDAAKLASAARAQRHAARELQRLAAAVARDAARCARPAAAANATATAGAAHAEAQVARAVAEAVSDIAAAAAAVFLEVGAVADAAAALAAPASSSSPNKKRLPPLSRSRQQRSTSSSVGDVVGEERRREGAAVEKLQELEQCVRELESESDKVFRSLLHTRVSLLNIHTPTF